MKAIIHIGPHKTGTTTIQSHLKANYNNLASKNIGYVPSSAVYVISACKPAGRFELDFSNFCYGQRHFQNPLFKNDPNFSQNVWNGLSKQIDENVDSVLFSNETFSSLSDSEVSVLASFIKERFDEIQIIVYLRRQPEIMVSYYGTMIEVACRPLTFNDILAASDDEVFWNYEALLTRWANVFGKQNVTPRIFDRNHFINNDLIDDFFHTAGISMTNLIRIENANHSMDQYSTEFLRMFRKYVPFADDSGKNNVFDNRLIATILRKHYKGSASCIISRATAESICERYKESNAAVSREWFGGQNIFNDDCSRYPEMVSDNDLTLDKSIEIASILWRELRLDHLRLQGLDGKL